MTTPETDPLFDALRARLGDHERAPAAASWAVVAAGLAAARRRRRWRWGFLLMGVIGVLGLIGVIGGRDSLTRTWEMGKAPRTSGATSSSSIERMVAPAVSGKASADLRTASPVTGRASADLRPASAVSGKAPAGLRTASAVSGKAPADLRIASAVSGKAPAGLRTAPTVSAIPSHSSDISHTAHPSYKSNQPIALLPTHATFAQTGRATANGLALLASRESTLQTDSLNGKRPIGAPQPVADSAHPVPPLPPSRWGVGVSGGLAVTHRRLASEGPRLSQIERWSVAGEGAISGRYALTPHLHLTAGVGYAAYRQRIDAVVVRQGTELAYVEQTITGPDGLPIRTLSWQWVPTAEVRSRRAVRAAPTARYLTLPVGAEWHPRGVATSARWQPVLAGALVPHVLLGARAATLPTETDEPALPTTRATTNLRPIALGLSAAVGVDYALRPDVWLTLRPAATLLLTNTAAPDAPRRHPWRVGLTVGLRWQSAPRRVTPGAVR